MYRKRGFSRREFLAISGKAALVGGLVGLGGFAPGLPVARASQTSQLGSLVWVWKFSADGDLNEIKDTLAANRLGVILKTHDGTHWMEEYDESPHAVTGPEQVAKLAEKFEEAGVPFHAWCVVQGTDTSQEAEMCASVLKAGARSLFLDLEPPDGANYWQGSGHDAIMFGRELRQLVPDAWLAVAPDSRPWQVSEVPIGEFAEFSNAIAPQAYWETFQGPTNRRRFAEHGYQIGDEGVTPEVVLHASVDTFQPFERPVHPIGQGASDPDRWRRFIAAARERNVEAVSLWRYGGADHGAFEVLRDELPQPQPEVVETISQNPIEQAPPAPESPEATEPKVYTFSSNALTTDGTPLDSTHQSSDDASSSGLSRPADTQARHVDAVGMRTPNVLDAIGDFLSNVTKRLLRMES